MQATPPAQRHALSRRVLLPDQFAADVSVSGDVEGDADGLAGFDATLVDLDPERPGLVQDALAQASAANHDAGNPILAALDQVQERLDLARLRLSANARHDKMFDVARQFVEHARGAAASGNWNLVQTFETAADVSLQEAAQPLGARQALTERFMHEDVKHDITVDPNAADPFATFKDHSKGHDDVGAIVEAVAGAALNVAAVFQPYLWPAAAALDTAQAGQDFADNNVLGGVLSLASAVGVGLNGLGNGYSVLGVTAGDLGLSAETAKVVGAGVLSAAALAGGTNAVVTAAQKGDGLGIAAGLLQIAAAAADGTISVQGGGSADLKLGALGLNVVAGATRLADGAQTGDLAAALGDVGALAAAVASTAQQVNTDPSLRARLDQLVAAVVASPPAVPVEGGGVQVAQTAIVPGAMTDMSGGLLDPAAFGDILKSAAAKGVELLQGGLIRIGGNTVVRGVLVAAPELGGFAVLVGGAVYLAANGGVSSVPVSGYDGTARGVAPVSAEVNGRAGTVLLYRGGTTDAPDLANQHTVTLSVGANGSLSDRQGRVVGRLDGGRVVANPGVSIPGLFGDAGVATPPTSLQPVGGGFTPSPALPTINEAAGVRPPNLAPEGATRDEALAKAKEDHNIPADQEPVDMPNERGGKNVSGSEDLLFEDRDGNLIVIRHDYAGETYRDDPSQDRGPHFNWDIIGNNKSDHYDYVGTGKPFGPLRKR